MPTEIEIAGPAVEAAHVASAPTVISEIDRLKLDLAKEKRSRLQAEALNLQMMQRNVMAQQISMEAEQKALFEHLRDAYGLSSGDEIGENGTIKRAPVRDATKEN